MLKAAAGRAAGAVRRLCPPVPASALPPPSLPSNLSSASPSDLARSVATALTHLSSPPPASPDSSSSTAAVADADEPHLDVPTYFAHHFSKVTFTSTLFRDAIALTPASAAPAAADLFDYLVSRHALHPSDDALSLVVAHLGRRRHFPGIAALLSDALDSAGPETLSAAFVAFARAGRASQAVRLFGSLPDARRDRAALGALVTALSDAGYPSYAERAVRNHAHEIFPDDSVCVTIIKGYCSSGKLDNATRLLDEARRGGFDPGVDAYNAILNCVCRVVRKKDPLRMHAEAEKLLVEMEKIGIPRNAETFRVLIGNLCKIRQTEDAVKVFKRMGEWGCLPDGETYLTLIRSLYQAARLSEGDEMMTWMRSAGFGKMLDRKAYYGFIKILCGIERVEHAVKVFRMMKAYGHAPGVKTYSLLIEKLARHNRADRANDLFKQAVARGVPVTPQVYKIDKRYVKVKKEKKVKKRLTLPEKMIKKSRRLYKIKMSFVRKSKTRIMRR